jgi:hypothetical protein
MVCTAGITFSPDIPADVDKLFSDSKDRSTRLPWNRQKQSGKKKRSAALFSLRRKNGVLPEINR